MRRIKVFGGLVYRGLSDSSKALFVSGSIAMSAVSRNGGILRESISYLQTTCRRSTFFENMKLHRKDRVNTFATMFRSVTIDSEKVTISTQTIFHRLDLDPENRRRVSECLK